MVWAAMSDLQRAVGWARPPIVRGHSIYRSQPSPPLCLYLPLFSGQDADLDARRTGGKLVFVSILWLSFPCSKPKPSPGLASSTRGKTSETHMILRSSCLRDSTLGSLHLAGTVTMFLPRQCPPKMASCQFHSHLRWISIRSPP